MEEKNFKDKMQELLSKVKVHVTDLGHLCKENKKTAGIIGGFLVLVVVGIVVASAMQSRSATTEEVAVEVPDAENGGNTIQVPEEALQENAYPEVNHLIQVYYQALAEGDLDTIRSIKNHTEEKEEIKIQKKSEFIDSYPTVNVYTKKGPEEGSLVVYAQYEVKFLNYDTTAPGLNTFYVCKNEDGSYYINDGELDEEAVEYLKAISAQNDVIDLFNTIQVKYNETKESDENLSAFLTELPDLLAESVGEALAQMEEEQKAETAAATAAEEPQVVTIVKKVKTKEVVNVRSSDSIEADRIGQTELGQVLVLIEEKLNGWSKVEFDGKEGYIKSEFLEPEEVEQVAATEGTETAEGNAETPAEVTTTKGKLTETVNVRKTPGTDGEKLGKLNGGADIEIVEKQADGWTKIKYKDGIAYVKSDYVK